MAPVRKGLTKVRRNLVILVEISELAALLINVVNKSITLELSQLHSEIQGQGILAKC